SIIFFYLFSRSTLTGADHDAVVHLYDGRWGAFEIKLGTESSISEAAENLKKFDSLVDTKHVGKPAFLAVITAIGYAYRRADGVYVIPIGCLRD
ncbi:MAG: hypothetical protein Q4E35_04335, partial [Eubacteriales bacterium]|nr:hypothetical protein [Eubacteriales bacterium]